MRGTVGHQEVKIRQRLVLLQVGGDQHACPDVASGLRRARTGGPQLDGVGVHQAGRVYHHAATGGGGVGQVIELAGGGLDVDQLVAPLSAGRVGELNHYVVGGHLGGGQIDHDGRAAGWVGAGQRGQIGKRPAVLADLDIARRQRGVCLEQLGVGLVGQADIEPVGGGALGGVVGGHWLSP